MSDHVFDLRLTAEHNPEDNTVTTMSVENLVEGSWQALDLCETTPGFLIFVYCIFACHHRFLWVGSRDREITITSSSGSIHLVADEDWHLQHISTEFKASSISGSASDEDIAYISDKILNCPVSRNMPANVEAGTSVVIE